MCMLVATLSFALLGLLSPANRGSLVTAFILLFVFMGAFAGMCMGYGFEYGYGSRVCVG
ncbi:hypothetical protein EON63_10980 [archaeon]|nr:MAG: hypothetical protein EON63_10980 [archaeon]